MCVCVCMHERVCACLHACVCACLCACACVHVCVCETMCVYRCVYVCVRMMQLNSGCPQAKAKITRLEQSIQRAQTIERQMLEMSQWMGEMGQHLQSRLDADLLAGDVPQEHEVCVCVCVLGGGGAAPAVTPGCRSPGWGCARRT